MSRLIQDNLFALYEWLAGMHIWEFLNQNLISNAIGAIIFGFIASLLFYKYTNLLRKKDLVIQMKSLIDEQLKEYLVIIDETKNLLNQEGINLGRPFLFSTSTFEVLLQGNFIENMDSSKSNTILILYNKVIALNKIYDSFVKYSIGNMSAYINTGTIKAGLKTILNGHLNSLKTAVDEYVNDNKLNSKLN